MKWNERMKEDFLMAVLRQLGYGISRAAVFIMLEDGILTEERDFEEYFVAHNIWWALEECRDDYSLTPQKIHLLTAGQSPEQARKIINAWDNTTKEELGITSEQWNGEME